jgi:hypothetical protein
MGYYEERPSGRLKADRNLAVASARCLSMLAHDAQYFIGREMTPFGGVDESADQSSPPECLLGIQTDIDRQMIKSRNVAAQQHDRNFRKWFCMHVSDVLPFGMEHFVSGAMLRMSQSADLSTVGRAGYSPARFR